MKRLYALLAAMGIAVSTLIAGCSLDQQPCMPAPMSLDTNVVHRGATVTVSAPVADCDLHYDSGKTYKITLVANRAGTHRLSTTTTSVDPDGSFTAKITVPETFAIGSAQIWVEGSPYDDCPPGASCVGYAAHLTIKA